MSWSNKRMWHWPWNLLYVQEVMLVLMWLVRNTTISTMFHIMLFFKIQTPVVSWATEWFCMWMQHWPHVQNIIISPNYRFKGFSVIKIVYMNSTWLYLLYMLSLNKLMHHRSSRCNMFHFKGRHLDTVQLKMPH